MAANSAIRQQPHRRPQLRQTNGGITRATFRVAVSGRSRDRGPSFFTVVVWRDQAEHAAESLSKDNRVVAVVVGRLQLDPSGRLWHGRYPLDHTVHAVSWEADQAAQILPDPGVVVLPIMAVHGVQVPWARSSPRACRWGRPGACQACFVVSQRCWGRIGSPTWPIRLGSVSTPPLDLGGLRGGSRPCYW